MICRRNRRASDCWRSRWNYRTEMTNSGGRYWDRTTELMPSILACGEVAEFMKFALVGITGSGKSTLGKKLSAETSLPYFELDGFFHNKDWVPTPIPEFKAKIEEILNENPTGWIIDGNYLSKLDGLVLDQADVVIWFNLSKRVVMYRIIKRSLHRVITRKRLWNGNRETLRTLVHPNPDINVVLWAWSQYKNFQSIFAAHKVRAKSSQKWIELTKRSETWTILGSNQ